MVVDRREVQLVEDGFQVLVAPEADEPSRCRNLRIMVLIVHAAQTVAGAQSPFVTQQLIQCHCQSAFTEVQVLSRLPRGRGRRVRPYWYLEINRANLPPHA